MLLLQYTVYSLTQNKSCRVWIDPLEVKTVAEGVDTSLPAAPSLTAVTFKNDGIPLLLNEKAEIVAAAVYQEQKRSQAMAEELYKQISAKSDPQ